jgi:hypothetical protein
MCLKTWGDSIHVLSMCKTDTEGFDMQFIVWRGRGHLAGKSQRGDPVSAHTQVLLQMRSLYTYSIICTNNPS